MRSLTVALAVVCLPLRASLVDAQQPPSVTIGDSVAPAQTLATYCTRDYNKLFVELRLGDRGRGGYTLLFWTDSSAPSRRYEIKPVTGVAPLLARIEDRTGIPWTTRFAVDGELDLDRTTGGTGTGKFELTVVEIGDRNPQRIRGRFTAEEDCPSAVSRAKMDSLVREGDRMLAEIEADRVERRRRIRASAWSPATKSALLAGRLSVGMTSAMVRLAWGSPERVNRTVTAHAQREQWVYGDDYVYLEGGRVVAIQTSR